VSAVTVFDDSVVVRVDEERFISVLRSLEDNVSGMGSMGRIEGWWDKNKMGTAMGV
jgi:hypothetical protein